MIYYFFTLNLELHDNLIINNRMDEHLTEIISLWSNLTEEERQHIDNQVKGFIEQNIYEQFTISIKQQSWYNEGGTIFKRHSILLL